MQIKGFLKLNKANVYILLFIAGIFCLPGLAQSYNSQQIDLAERLHFLAKTAPPEIAYIQTSKDIYETGEDLWFKVYLLDAQYLLPSLLSKTLYLQLLGENNRQVVWTEKYEIQNGISFGRVYLESKMPEGNYFLAVYTPNSFFNDTIEFKAVRRIKIIKDISTLTSETAISENLLLIAPVPKNETNVQFESFPEGGDIVSGIPCKLAFKAININGEPIDIKGKLFEDNIPISEFNSKHAGMGFLNFTPDKSKKYFIQLSQPAIDTIFHLPEIFPEGMTLTLIDRNKESLTFKILQSIGLKPGEFYIRVQCRGVVYGMTMGKINREAIMKIPLSLLPQGIAEVTLFNSSLIPVAERLVYVNQDRKLNIRTELSEKAYPTRGKAILKITVTDENGQPTVANLGVSIFDRLYQNPRDSNNILSHLYLSSQLKGRIYNPSFYFDKTSKDREEAMDLLMLTQGWRRYVWNEMNLKRSEEAHRQVIFDGIKGKAYFQDRKNKIQKEKIFVMAFSPNKDSMKVMIQADSIGVFTIPPARLKEWENDYVYLKPFCSYDNKKPFKSYDPLAPPEFSLLIKLTDPFETINQFMKPKEISYPLPGLKTEPEGQSKRYSLDSGVVRIKEVVIKGQKNSIIRGKYLGTLDSLAMLDAEGDYVCRFGVLNCPRHDRNEPGTTRPSQGRQYFVIYDYNTQIERSRIITYWRPDYSEDGLLRINNLTRVKTYYGHREFYKPNYDKETDERIPDFRNTLLWEPNVITNEDGEATLTFFCSDINTDFVGRIEGVSGEGLLGTGYFIFAVRKLKFAP